MIKFSSEEIVKVLQAMGLDEKDCMSGGIVKDIYTAIGADLKITSSGARVLTPYEILKTPPVFAHGKEKPIVFAIKNKNNRTKLGKYEGSEHTYYYKSNKNKKEKDLLETLKSGYRRAVFLGDDVSAKNYLDMIDTVTKGKSKEFVDSFFDYTRYYKRMKKQLIMDLFAHFFLMYIYKSIKSVKRGVNAKNKSFKPFKREDELESEYEQSEPVGYVPDIAELPNAFGISNIEKVTIKDSENEIYASFDFSNDAGKGAKFDKTQEDKVLTVEDVEAQIRAQEAEEQKQANVETEHKMESVDVSLYDSDAPKLFGRTRKSFLKKRDRFLAKHLGMSSEEEVSEADYNYDSFEQTQDQIILNEVNEEIEKQELENKNKLKKRAEFERNMDI